MASPIKFKWNIGCYHLDLQIDISNPNANANTNHKETLTINSDPNPKLQLLKLIKIHDTENKKLACPRGGFELETSGKASKRMLFHWAIGAQLCKKLINHNNVYRFGELNTVRSFRFRGSHWIYNYRCSIYMLHVTHTHTTVLRLCGICPGKPGWAGTRRNIHPLLSS